MKHIMLIILSLTLGLANPVLALEAGERHADPYKVMTQGQVIGQDIIAYESGNTHTSFLIAYQGEMYRCLLAKQGNTYSCLFLEPKIN